MIFRSKHKIGTIVVVILAELQLCWSNRRLGRFILHALFSQANGSSTPGNGKIAGPVFVGAPPARLAVGSRI